MNSITIDGTVEKDINDSQWSKFVIERPISYYSVSQADIQRPDLISNKVYGNTQYFWVLMKFNQIDDIWNDLSAGDVLKCPNSFDIEQFFSVTKNNG